MQTPFYDPERSYEENFAEGPFGDFSDGVSVERTGEPEHDFLGLPVFVPFGIPAGPLINARFVVAAFAKGFDVCTYKTVRTREYPCHPHPNVLAVHLDGDLTPELAAGSLVADDSYREPLSITNSFGVPSKDPDFWQADMARAVESTGKGQVLIGSFQGTKREGGSVDDFIEDCALAARLVAETGAPILEANLSCPNEGTAELLCFDVERVRLICERIKAEIGDRPLIIKLAHFADDKHLLDLVNAVGGVVQGLAAINTIPAKIVDAHGRQALPGGGRAVSGVCGSSIKWAGLDMVKRLAALRQKLDLDYAIIGVGGVMTTADFLEYRAAGAECVQSATGAMWNPHLAQAIIDISSAEGTQ